jgi:L-serine dehydratase
MIYYDSIKRLVDIAEKEGKNISDIVMEDQAYQMEKDPAQLFEEMARQFKVMEESVSNGLMLKRKSASGLSGIDAAKMKKAVDEGKTISGRLVAGALAKALAVAESNACMGRIVAAPTAGSCGILPAVLIALKEEKQIQESKIVMGLFTAAAVGMVVAKRASVAGAEGGCQAECGSASAMAAAAAVEIMGGTPRMVSSSCAISLKSVLGLVCDPVAGLVEVPCIKRNAIGVANAIASADMALAGVDSVIPADEVIDAMKAIGAHMPQSLRETSEGGLAITPTGIKIAERIYKQQV